MQRTRPLSPLALSLPALSLLALTAGCAHKATVVGKWQGTTTQPRGAMNTTFEFASDGKETLTIQGNMGGMPIAMSGTGTYTVSDTTLTQTLTTMTIGNRPVPIPAGQSQPQSNAFTLDGDHLTLTSPAGKQSLTLTRVKE